MTQYAAKRVRFQNGERISVLQRAYGLPVHEATLFLNSLRRRGLAANTIHFVCSTLAIVHRELDKAGVDLMERLWQGRFFSRPELSRLTTATQYRVADSSEDTDDSTVNVISIHRLHPRLKDSAEALTPVDVDTQAKRHLYIAKYLEFLTDYAKFELPSPQRQKLEEDAKAGLKAFRAEIPAVRIRTKVGERIGLTEAEQDKLLKVVDPNSPNNPWQRGFVRRRNWLIVVLLLATGMRRGELLGLQIKDIESRTPKLKILRRADDEEDPRIHEPNAKTGERIVELSPSIGHLLWRHINDDRYAIKSARKYPQVIVSDEGTPLSHSSIDLMFRQLRKACPDLPVRLTSHVMRHTWNERFSEQAEKMMLSEVEEEKARNEQQGWSDNSRMGATYTRRRIAKKGRELTLRIQEKLDEQIVANK